MANVFAQQGNYFRIQPEDKPITSPILAPGTYVVQAAPMVGFFLEQIEPSAMPKKVYGTHEKDAERILNTFNSRPRSTGVLLAGDKGSGKTLLSRMISKKAAELYEMPTLIVNSPFSGDSFNAFLNDITQPCVVLFDEFEKVYDHDAQQQLLTLFDGVLTSHKLFVMTANDNSKIETHMRNRPGRLFYLLDYSGITPEFIRDYALDNLDDKTQVPSLVAISGLFYQFNFDMLQAIIEEMNRYKETAPQALRLLNCKPEMNRQKYDAKLVDAEGNKLDLNDGQVSTNPLMQEFHLYYGEGGKDEDGDWKNWQVISFNPGQITSFNGVDGIVVLKSEKGFTVTLTREKPATYDFSRAYDIAGYAAS